MCDLDHTVSCGGQALAFNSELWFLVVGFFWRVVFVCLFVFSFSLPYESFFGGVSALTPEHYMKMNGFPNTYWGDGGENDDIATRYQCTGQA